MSGDLPRIDAARERPIEVGKLLLDVARRRALWNGRSVDLTLGEFAVVHLLASQPGAYMTYLAIYRRSNAFTAGKEDGRYRMNVRGAIKRIRKKFDACDPTFDEIKNYYGFGYCWRQSELRVGVDGLMDRPPRRQGDLIPTGLGLLDAGAVQEDGGADQFAAHVASKPSRHLVQFAKLVSGIAQGEMEHARRDEIGIATAEHSELMAITSKLLTEFKKARDEAGVIHASWRVDAYETRRYDKAIIQQSRTQLNRSWDLLVKTERQIRA